MSVTQFFEDLGERVRSDWSQHDFAASALPDIACVALAAAPPSAYVTPDELVEWVAHATALPRQPNLSTTFGQPPLTVFYDERFYIEALFWTTATTAIHEHGFSGAFHVLAGSSLQSRYQFVERERPCDQLLLGELTLWDVKILKRGDIEPIVGGSALIHSVFHLDAPSVTVVVRTHIDDKRRPQYRYLKPYVAIDPQFEDPLTTRRVQILGLLQKLSSPRYAAFAAAALEKADLWGTFRILERLRQHAGFMQLPYDQFLATAERRHGDRARQIDAAIAEEDRVARLHARR